MKIKNDNNKLLEDKIHQYVNARLNDEEIEQLWAELIAEPYYYDYLKSTANLKYVLEENQEKKRFINASARKRNYWMAIAASIAITIGILGYMFQINHSSRGSIEPLSNLAFTNLRSAEVMNATPQAQIKKGINYANSGKTADAISLFTKLKQGNNTLKIKSEADLNLGIIYYNQHDYSKAIRAFNDILNTNKKDVLMREKAYWYSGNAYLKMGNLENARKSIQSAYDLNGAYRRIAGKYLKELNNKLSKK